MSVTLVICIVTFLISYQAFNNPSIIESLKHYPIAENRNKEYYRLLSSGFVHGGWMHLLINLFVLYQFGPIVENIMQQVFGVILGPILFVTMYLTTIIVADLPTYFKHKDNPAYAAIGASGAVSGVVFIYILFFPWTTLSLYGIIPFKAIIGGIGYLIYSSWASSNRNDGTDHSAHFYGAVYGILFMIILYPPSISRFLSEMQNILNF
jgi:membrane associated rhomboid family serine protease